MTKFKAQSNKCISAALEMLGVNGIFLYWKATENLVVTWEQVEFFLESPQSDFDMPLFIHEKSKEVCVSIFKVMHGVDRGVWDWNLNAGRGKILNPPPYILPKIHHTYIYTHPKTQGHIKRWWRSEESHWQWRSLQRGKGKYPFYPSLAIIPLQ